MQVVEIVFPSAPRPRGVVRALPHQPLPPVPTLAPTPPPPPREPAPPPPSERQLIADVLAQLRRAADELGARHTAALDEMRQAAVELALAVAGRLVFDKLHAGDFPVEEMVRQAVARLPAAPAVTVYLHPDDLALLHEHVGDGPLLPTREPTVRLEPDVGLRRGGCRAEAGEIHVLADLADQLAELRRHLLGSVRHARPGPGAAAP